MSGRDGPAQAVKTPNVAMLVIANANQLQFNLQETRLMPATLPLAVSFAHLRWHAGPAQTSLRIYLAGPSGA